MKTYPVLDGVVHGEVDVPTAGPVRLRFLPGHVIREDDLLSNRHFLLLVRILFVSQPRAETLEGTQRSKRRSTRNAAASKNVDASWLLGH